jgi:uncharacterized DUF497 family protein
MYSNEITFVWNAAKSERNLRERGFDFEFASLVFAGPTLEREDNRRDYGERRVLAIGVADGIELVIVFTDRVLRRSRIERRIISARRANRKERAIYEAAIRAQESESGTGRP